MNHLREIVEEDADGFELAKGSEIWTYGSTNPDFSDGFNAAMQSRSRSLNTIIVQHYEGFRDVKRLVDVGGGVGGALTHIVAANPHISGVNFDLPHVVATAPQISGEWHMILRYFELSAGWIDSRCCKVVNCLRNSFSIVWVFPKSACLAREDDRQ